MVSNPSISIPTTASDAAMPRAIQNRSAAQRAWKDQSSLDRYEERCCSAFTAPTAMTPRAVSAALHHQLEPAQGQLTSDHIGAE